MKRWTNTRYSQLQENIDKCEEADYRHWFVFFVDLDSEERNIGLLKWNDFI
jgi:hypothetical protein